MSKKATIAVIVVAVLALVGLMTAIRGTWHSSSTSAASSNASTAAVVTVTDMNDFQSQVKNSTLPVFIIFTASDPKCTPCQQEEPLIEQAAKDYAGKVKFIRIDATKTPDIASQNGIQAVPTLFVVKLQEKTAVYVVGFLDAQNLHKFIEDGLNAQAKPAANPGTNSPAAPASPATQPATPATDPTQQK